MGVDRMGGGTDTPAEAVGEPPRADRRPPPDRPGTEGAPSRADSRHGAAAANEKSPQTTDRPSQETPEGQDSAAEEKKPEATGTPESTDSSGAPDGVSGERHETDNAPADPVGGPEAEQTSTETGNADDSSGRVQARDGLVTPQGSPSAAGFGEQPVSADATEQRQGKVVGERPADGETADAGTLAVQDTDGSAATNADSAAPVPKTQDAPHDPPDAPHDVDVEAAREETKPADDTAKTIEPTAESGDRSQTAERPQTGVPGESSEGDVEDVGPVAGRPLGDRLMVGDKPLRQYLDPAGYGAQPQAMVDVEGEGASEGKIAAEGEPSGDGAESAWLTGGPDIAGDLPTGEELVKMENGRLSRAERARRKVYESGDEVLDDVGKVVNRVDQIFQRPPIGHTVTRTGPEFFQAPHDGLDAGDAATALVATGAVVGEIVRRVRERAKERKGG
jgi:hypothetical protein